MSVAESKNQNSTDPWVIEAENLAKVYRLGAGQVHALRGVSLQVHGGEFLALMGASGSGKSTLMHLLGCLDTPTSGTYSLEGRDVGALSRDERATVRNRRIGFIFQTFNLLPRLNALDNVTLPLLYRGQAGRPKERAAAALKRVGFGRPRRAPPRGAIWRRMSARGHRPRPGHRSGDHPRRRADGQPG